MRLRRAAAVASVAAVLGPGATARAQHVETKASITLTGAYTQSLSDYQYPTAQTFAVPTIALSPSFIALIDTWRTENTLTYAFSLGVPLAKQITVSTPPVTYSNRFTYAGHYALSEITSMTFGAGFTEAPLNTFIPSQDPTAAPIEAVPAGDAVMITVSTNEGFSRQITDLTSFTQTGSFIYGNPIDPTTERAQTYSASNSFGINRIFSRDTVGLTLTNQFNYFTISQASAGAPAQDATSAWVNTLALNWLHPFTEAFSSNVTAGATMTLSPDSLTLVQVQPTGGLTLNYNFLLATAALAYSHTAQPNLTTGTVNFADMASLRFSVPIGLTGFTTTGTAGYTHTVPLGTPEVACPATVTSCNSNPLYVGPSNVFVADAMVEYKPERVPTLTVGVRGQLTRQVLTDDIMNTFTRYTVSLNLTYSYPNANAASTRPQLSPLYSAQPPPASDVTSTDRFFSGAVSGPAPAEPLPLPKGP